MFPHRPVNSPFGVVHDAWSGCVVLRTCSWLRRAAAACPRQVSPIHLNIHRPTQESTCAAPLHAMRPCLCRADSLHRSQSIRIESDPISSRDSCNPPQRLSPREIHLRLGSCLALTPVETYASRHAPLAGVKREPGGRRLPPVVSQACSKPAAASRATVRPAAEAAPRAPLVTPGAAAPPLPRSGLHPRTPRRSPLLSSARCRIS